MNIKEFMKNPSGKGAVIPGREMIIEKFNYRYKLLLKKKQFDVNIYKIKDDILYHVIMTTEADERWNTYDVVLKFIPTTMAAKNDSTVKNYEMQIFSNCPSFTYTYAYVAKLNNILVPELQNKYSKNILAYPPVSRNPSLMLNYEKSIYYACKYLMESGMLNKSYINMHVVKSTKDLLSDIRTESQIEEEIQRSKSKLKYMHEKEKRDIRHNRVKSQHGKYKNDPNKKTSVHYIDKKGSTVKNINKKKSTIKPKGGTIKKR